MGRLIELEAGAVQPKHCFTCVNQLINNEAIFTKTKQIQSRNIAVVDEKLNNEREHDWLSSIVYRPLGVLHALLRAVPPFRKAVGYIG